MSQLSDDILDYFENAILPSAPSTIFNNYTQQWGVWNEESAESNKRYYIVKPNGGAASDLTLEQPNYSLFIIGKEREGLMGFSDSVGEVADAIMKYLKNNPSYGCYILIKEVAQPIGPGITTGNRPWYTINVRTKTGG